MANKNYTIEIINPMDKAFKTDYTNTVFDILKTIYSTKDLEYIVQSLKLNKGGSLESCNLH